MDFKKDFPMMNKDIIYFDNGATTLKPNTVIDEISNYYRNYSANAHRGDYDISRIVDEKYENTRNKVAEFINADSASEIVFTSGATESLNLAIKGFLTNYLKAGDEILTTKAEHASIILPLFDVSKRTGARINYIDLNDDLTVTIENVKKAITKNTKVIALAHITNVIGDIRDVYAIGEICKNKNIYFCVDGAQSVPHLKVDFKKANMDFLSFSGHKMLGPTGVGVLVGKYDLLQEMEPLCYGGGMNQSFEADSSYELKNAPTKLEAGTPAIAEVIGLRRAIKYLMSIGMEKIEKHEQELKEFLISELEKIPNIVLYNKNSKSGILAFNIDGVFAQESSIYLNHYHIYVRAGNHCAKMLKDEINIKNTVRVSMYLYNTKEDVLKLVEALKNSHDIFKIVL